MVWNPNTGHGSQSEEEAWGDGGDLSPVKLHTLVTCLTTGPLMFATLEWDLLRGNLEKASSGPASTGV